MLGHSFLIKGSSSTHVIPGTHEDIFEFAPLRLPFPPGQFALAGQFAVALDEKGDAYVWGILASDTIPSPIKIFQHIEQISCGWDHALLKSRAGGLLGFGSTKYGELGFTSSQYCFKPERLVKELPVDGFAAGFRQSYAVIHNELWGCGSSKYYELGNQNANPSQWVKIGQVACEIVRIHTSKKSVCLHGSNGEVWALGVNDNNLFGLSNSAKTLMTLTKIKSGVRAMASGWSHLVFLTVDRHLLSHGKNNFGQLGRTTEPQIEIDLDREEEVETVVSGSEFSFAITNRKRVFGWGWNEHRNVVNTAQIAIFSPVLMGENCLVLWTYPAIVIMKCAEQ